MGGLGGVPQRMRCLDGRDVRYGGLARTSNGKIKKLIVIPTINLTLTLKSNTMKNSMQI